MPGMLGRLRSVRTSAMVTNIKVASVPNHPHLFRFQNPKVKMSVIKPNIVVYVLYTLSMVEAKRSHSPKSTWIAPTKDWIDVNVKIPMLLPEKVGGRALLIGLHF